jgi:hypothetical protein
VTAEIRATGRLVNEKRVARITRTFSITGAVGTSADNTSCESFHVSLKRETLQGAHDYGDAGTCHRTVFARLTRHNARRRHSASGHLGPTEYEPPGPHRVCAMRQAEVAIVPGYGRYLPGKQSPDAIDAREHARETIEHYWVERLVAPWRPGAWPQRLGSPLARYRILRWPLPRPDQREE